MSPCLRLAALSCSVLISVGCGSRAYAPNSLRQTFPDSAEQASPPSEIRKSQLELMRRFSRDSQDDDVPADAKRETGPQEAAP